MTNSYVAMLNCGARYAPKDAPATERKIANVGAKTRSLLSSSKIWIVAPKSLPVAKRGET
jgi:hypothetical protein